MTKNSACDKKYKITLKEGHCIKVKGLNQDQITEIIKRFYFSGCENNLHINSKAGCKIKDEDRAAYYIWSYLGLIRCDLPKYHDSDAVELSYDQLMEEQI